MTVRLRQAVRDFVRLVESHEILYALAGGLAARAHGIPCPTLYVDFTVTVERSRIQDVLLMQGERDRDYMRQWAERLGASLVLEESFRKYEESPDTRP